MMNVPLCAAGFKVFEGMKGLLIALHNNRGTDIHIVVYDNATVGTGMYSLSFPTNFAR